MLAVLQAPQLFEPLISRACDRFGHKKKAEPEVPPERFALDPVTQDPAAVTPRASLARSANRRKVSGSRTATSASIFRFSSIPAMRRPDMSWLYDRPSRRAAALIRTIH